MSEQIKASRRGILKAGLTVLAGTVAVATAARAQDAAGGDKVEQSSVQYQDKPSDDGLKCSGCVNFVVPNACKVVLGNISPEGYCVAYAPKAK